MARACHNERSERLLPIQSQAVVAVVPPQQSLLDVGLSQLLMQMQMLVQMPVFLQLA